ncbi:hypothetical protein [Bacillus sp. JUb91]|uniref:hypothetical protein n=1 Tax=Bacillus sp. JUb91 TaxID=2940596 RepID=UPI00216797FB|nr:hypothetical protein [Bacillus sp. JUb91]MCS3600182.1 hypothetical protein [Bacillus sp. JUb91]
MIRNVMTDEEITVLESHLSDLKEKFNIKVDELYKIHQEIKERESELKNQKILIATFDEIFPKK